MEQMAPEQTLALLTEGKVAHIGVIDDAEPYVSPVSYAMVDKELCFRTGKGRRVEALRSNPRVSIEVMRIREDGGWECVIASGEATEIDDPQKSQQVISSLLSKYADELGSPLTGGARPPVAEPAVLFSVALDTISGRSSGSWFTIPTRPGRL